MNDITAEKTSTAHSPVDVLRAIIDLTRAHFSPVWPLLFGAGLMLAFRLHGGFSVPLLIKAMFIGFLGFEGGLVLNDIVDRNHDKKDIENSLTSYWRPFGMRPLSSGAISLRTAVIVFLTLSISAVVLIFTIPAPHSYLVFLIMAYSYAVEYFYQVKKRSQSFPFAQIVGRSDLALFPAAGYLCHGSDIGVVVLIFLFLYPWALVHLGVNDLADVRNDHARGMKTIPVLYGEKGALLWVLCWALLHSVMVMGMIRIESSLVWGFSLGLFLVLAAFAVNLWKRGPVTALYSLPLLHASLAIYALTVIITSL